MGEVAVPDRTLRLAGDSYDREYSEPQIARRFATYARPHLAAALAVTALTLAGAGLGTGFQVLIARGVDTVARSVRPAALAALIAAVVLVGAAQWAGGALAAWLSARLSADMILGLRRDAFAAVLRQESAFFDQHPAGGLVSRVTTDSEAVSGLVSQTFAIAGQVVLILCMLGVLLSIDLLLAGVTILLMALIVVVSFVHRRVSRRWSRQEQRAVGRLNALLHESVGGLPVARNFAQEGTLYAALDRANRQWFAVSRWTRLLQNSFFPTMLTATGLGTAAIVLFGGHQVLDSRLSPGQWYLFIQTLSLLWWPLMNLSSFWGQLQQGTASAERILSLVDAEPRVRQSGHARLDRDTSIEFRNVGFRYSSREAVLDGFDLRIATGETVALIGHTGAGKSTIVRLIARAYEFDAGAILVGGHDIRGLDADDYRRRLGIVPQAPVLLKGTVADNIRYPCPGATDEQVLAVARLVARGDWLAPLARGLETPVGELGRNLSAGQRQLVALARLLLQDPSILLLDEATASVDPLTEAHIQEGLEVVLRGRTVVTIAHRLTTVRRADRIVALRQGRIVEEGRHDDLLAAGGYYADLYDRYFRHQAPDFDPQQPKQAVR